MTAVGGYGWYGKVPCVGDFVRDGLSVPFIQAWDLFLQKLLLEGREAVGSGWQEAYFSAPIWRFALDAGLCGPTSMVGVVMPSVDRVGREFPFCIASACEGTAYDAYLGMASLFDELEDAALNMLEDGSSLEELKGRLATLPFPPAHAKDGSSAEIEPFAFITRQAPESILASLGAEHASSIWVAVLGDDYHCLLANEMPSGAIMAEALFDLQAPFWQEAKLAKADV